MVSEEMDLYADRRESAGVATVGGRATRRERISGLPWRQGSKPVTKPESAAADLKPMMTEGVEGAVEMGAVTKMSAANGVGRKELLLLLDIVVLRMVIPGDLGRRNPE